METYIKSHYRYGANKLLIVDEWPGDDVYGLRVPWKQLPDHPTGPGEAGLAASEPADISVVQAAVSNIIGREESAGDLNLGSWNLPDRNTLYSVLNELGAHLTTKMTRLESVDSNDESIYILQSDNLNGVWIDPYAPHLDDSGTIQDPRQYIGAEPAENPYFSIKIGEALHSESDSGSKSYWIFDGPREAELALRKIEEYFS